MKKFKFNDFVVLKSDMDQYSNPKQVYVIDNEDELEAPYEDCVKLFVAGTDCYVGTYSKKVLQHAKPEHVWSFAFRSGQKQAQSEIRKSLGLKG